MAERLLRTNEVLDRTGLGRTTVWRMERAGQFPPRRQIGGGIVGWLESEVDAWIHDRPVAHTPDHDRAA
jgi:prophage regulatory protein